MYDAQKLFEKIGSMGWSQILFSIYLAYGKLWVVYTNLSAIYTNYIPDYRCKVLPFDHTQLYQNLTELEIVNYTTRYDTEEQKYEFCSRYGYNTSTCVNGSLSCVDTSLPTIPCDRGYKFDTNVMETTAVTKFDLVCDKLFLNSLSTAMFFLGMVAAAIVFGNLADNIGRLKALILGQFLFIAGSVGGMFSVNIAMYITTRFILSLGNHGSEIVLQVYASELTASKTRTLLLGVVNGGGIIGQLVLSGAAYFWRTDFAILTVAVLGTTPFAILAFIVDESPRWLLTKNKTDQAKKVFKRMGRINGITRIDEDFDNAKIPRDERNEHEREMVGKSESRKSFMDLFKSREMSKIVLLVSLNWFSCVFVYYGISLNAGAISGDIFLNTIINVIMEAAAYVLVVLTMDRLGRRRLLASSHLIAGFGLIVNMIITLIHHSESALPVTKVMAFIAKFGISFSFGIVYQYTNELFPTELRSNGLGLCTTAARACGIFAPFLIDLQQMFRWLPNTIFGATAVIAGLSTFLLPDTVGMKLLEDEEEAIYFYKNWRSMRNKRAQEKKSVKCIVNDAFEMNEENTQ